jgi:hypothetical protein
MDMAFVRWRGRSSQLLATVYEDGRSKKVTLANLPGFYVSEATKRDVQERFPHIKVDWASVDRALAQGAPGTKKTIPPEHLDWASVEHCLRKWASHAEDPEDVKTLLQAAEILTRWRVEHYWESHA